MLGMASGYNSESDEDYQPARPTKKPRGSGRATARRAAAGSPLDSSSDASDSADSFHSDSSTDSGETLAARQQRRLSKSPAQARGAGTAARRARAATAQPPAVITTWDQLPTAVLAQIFLAVCKHGALPMAPRLACVCTSWSAAVDATPELWHLIDTAAIPARSWVQEPAVGGVRSPPSEKQQGAKGKQAAGRKGKRLSAEQGLRLWAASGRLQELQALLLYGEGANRFDPQDGTGRDANRQLSPALLQELADSCQQLHRVSLFGAWSLRPEEVSSALLSMPALSELWLAGMRFPPLTGLTSCICSVLEAAAVTGCPRLKELVLDGCASLGQKAVSALCPSAEPAQPQAGTAADEEGQEAGQHQPPQQAGSGQHAALERRPALPHLELLDLSHCAGLLGKPAKLQLDDMQAALPNLRVLKLTGLGGLYGWQAGIRSAASLPGFPALESLHIGCDLSAPHNGRIALRAGSSYVNDAVLLALAGKSLRLATLDLTGCLVTPDGLRQLAAAHAAARPAAPAAAGAAAGAPAAGQQAAAGAAAAAAGAAGQAPSAAGAPGAAALRVRDLQLDGSGLACDAGLVAVGECCCDNLEQLVVRNAGARVGDEGIRGLRACMKLAALDVAACSVTEEGLSDLLSALPAGVLEEVHLESCRSVSRGARQAAARGVVQLQEYLAAEHA